MVPILIHSKNEFCQEADEFGGRSFLAEFSHENTVQLTPLYEEGTQRGLYPGP